ncbi:MAG: hypothetical protein K6E85_00115 [Lachnospiraceae bacterium]|nr:hypothetical protein [Lachnospiraceae bacterium]
MQIGIELDNYDSPIEEFDQLVNNYAREREIGYLKINPERIPVIISEEKVSAEFNNKKYRGIGFPLNNGHYELITTEEATAMMNGDCVLLGNGYIGRRQGDSITGLTFDEISHLLKYLEHLDKYTIPGLFGKVNYVGLLFKYDKERGCWG